MANEPPASLSRNLGRQLVQLRRARSLSQAALAQIAGVPRSTLTHLESGHGNPSLANLARIAGALQVSIEELLAEPRAECQLVAAGALPVQRRSQGAALVYKLLPDPIPGMEMDRLEIEPAGRMGGVPHSPGTKEYLTCVRGEITVHVTGQKFRLLPGDVLAFPGDRAHSYHNTGAARCICLSVVVLAPPGVARKA